MVVFEEFIEPFGLYLWPSGIALAFYLWSIRDTLPGSTILELGAGVGLPGLLAAKLGANVILSDSSEFPGVLENLQFSCEENGVQCCIVDVKWGTEIQRPPQCDLIIGADLFYESGTFEDLLATVRTLLLAGIRGCNGKSPRFVTTYHHRDHHSSIEHILTRFDLNVVKVWSPFSVEGIDPQIPDLDLIHFVEMVLSDCP